MKKVISFFALALLFISCSKGYEDSAKHFTENMAKGKTEEAKKYATESTGKMIDFAAGFGGAKVSPNYQFKKVKDSVAGDEAWVTYIDEKEKEQTLKLVKIDGKWLVHVESKK